MQKKETPSWLKKRIVASPNIFEMKRLLKEMRVQTVCESALCPNLNECFSQTKATFLILGDACTRSCGFCAVKNQAPGQLDPLEPEKISTIIKRLDLKYVVITSVTRDDLNDGGASQFAKVIGAIRNHSRMIKIEVLTPDFGGKIESVKKVMEARPDIFGHNIEIVKRLYPLVRGVSSYHRALDLLKSVKEINPRQLTKSGIMVGLGEREEEVVDTMKDLRIAGCDILTVGQYLKARAGKLAVDRFATPREFERYRIIGEMLGFKSVSSGPFVRSSYFAEKVYKNLEEKSYGECYATAIS